MSTLLYDKSSSASPAHTVEHVTQSVDRVQYGSRVTLEGPGLFVVAAVYGRRIIGHCAGC